MKENKLSVEIYQGDPFSGSCCGPGQGPQESLEKLRTMLTERHRILERLQNEFQDEIRVKRETISAKRWNYPEYVRRLMSNKKPLPYIFLNKEAVVVGSFPSYEEFVTIIRSHVV